MVNKGFWALPCYAWVRLHSFVRAMDLAMANKRPRLEYGALQIRSKTRDGLLLQLHRELRNQDKEVRSDVRQAKRNESVFRINLEHMRTCAADTKHALDNTREVLSALQAKFDKYKVEAEQESDRLRTQIATLREQRELEISCRSREVRAKALESVQLKGEKLVRLMASACQEMFRGVAIDIDAGPEGIYNGEEHGMSKLTLGNVAAATE